MTQGRWKRTQEQLATEAYFVLVDGRKPSRSMSREYFLSLLPDPDVYVTFLKICVELDSSEDLVKFRKGLLLVIKSMGPTKVAKTAGLNRVTLYRLLSKKANPGLKNIVKILHALELRFWIVGKTLFGEVLASFAQKICSSPSYTDEDNASLNPKIT